MPRTTATRQDAIDALLDSYVIARRAAESIDPEDHPEEWQEAQRHLADIRYDLDQDGLLELTIEAWRYRDRP